MNIKKLALWVIGLVMPPCIVAAQQNDTLRQGTDTLRQLGEVVIREEKPVIEHQADKTIVHIGSLTRHAGATAYEVLEQSPGIIIQNGNVSMKGKPSVLVLVDGKPTYLSGAELENLLKAMSADGLSQIELMTNPPAKYDAAGNAGIVNIISRKNKVRGFNGGANLVLRQSKQSSNYNTLFANYRENKFNFSATLSGGYRQTFENLDIERAYRYTDGRPGATYRQHAYSSTRGGIGRVKLGVDYYQDERTTWGIGFTGNLWQSNRKEDIGGRSLLDNGSEAYSVQGYNTDKTLHQDGWLSLNYRHAFRQPGRELLIDADYLTYAHQPDQSFSNYIHSPVGKPDTADLLEGSLASDIRIYTVKADYTQPVFRQWKLDAGAKAVYTQTDNAAAYQYTYNGITRPDYDKSNHFKYKENINAAYLNLGREGKVLSVQVGLRLENTRIDGHQLGNALKADSSFQQRYTQLFPTAYLLYKPDTSGRHTIGLSYGQRIDRPYFQDLNPFVTPIDRFTFYTGNPFLKPAFTHSVELSYSYQNWFTVTLSYSRSRDNINETVMIRDNIFYSRPGNIGSRVVKSINIDASKDLNSWLNVHLYAEWTHVRARTDFYSGLLDNQGNFVVLNPDFRIELGKTWSADLGGRFISSVFNVQLETGAYWLMNAGIQKRFSDAASLKLSLRDIFYTQVNSGTVHNLEQAAASWSSRNDSRMAVLTFSYRFGKAIAGRRKHEPTGIQGEQNRIRN